MRIRDLGPLVVDLGDRSIDLGRTRAAALLARLALTPAQPVSADGLVSAAWGLDAHVSASSLDSQLWRLRNLVEPDRARSASVLVRSAGGYQLVVAPDQVDSARFSRLAASTGEPASQPISGATLEVLDEALALWRGEPFEPITDHPDVVPVASYLIEQRQQLEERRIEALMGLGQVDRALADLVPVIAATPYRERLWALRIQCLATTGRTEEALVAFQQVRDLLHQELGLSPGPELHELQSQVLSRQLPASPRAPRGGFVAEHGTRPEQPAAVAPGRSRAQLPRRANPLIGRASDLDRIAALVIEQPLVSLVGAGGCGKTRLSIEVGAAVAEQFADGVWFFDLSSVSDPQLVVDVVVSALGLAASPISDPAQVLADFLSNRRLLLILDNCEHVLDGAARCVELILDSGPMPAVLATSREPLAVEGEIVWSLAPLSVVSTASEPDGAAPAVRLFLDRARAAAPELELGPTELAVVERICHAVDGLPLAIELAAARMRMVGIAEVADQVSSDPSRLSRLGRSQPDHRRTVFDTIEWSYRLLGPREQALHRLLSVLPGEFPVTAARAIATPEGPGATIDVESGLAALVHSSMLVARRSPTGGTVFAQLDTVRAHARRRLHEAGEEQLARHRRDGWVRGLLSSRPRLGWPAEADWLDRVHASYALVRACLQDQSGPDGDPELVRLGSDLAFYWYYRGRLVEGVRWLQAVQEGGPPARTAADDGVRWLRLAALCFLRSRPDLAAAPLRRGLAALQVDDGQVDDEQVDDAQLIDVTETLVAVAGSAWSCEAYELVGKLAARIRPLAARAGDAHLDLLAELLGHIGDLPMVPLAQTKHAARAAFERAEAVGNLFGQYMAALLATGVAALEQDPVAGLAWTKRVVPIYLRLGDEGGSVFLESLANLAAMGGDFAEAARLYAGARALARNTGSRWPNRPQTPELQARTTAALDPAELVAAEAAGSSLTLAEVAAEWSAEDAVERSADAARTGSLTL